MTDRKIKRKHYLVFIAGGLSVILFLALSNKTIEYTSTDEFCSSCHVHPHADATWKLSVHNNTKSGVSVKCVDCHLPPRDQQVKFLTRKTYHVFHDFYVYMTEDVENIDWADKRTREAAKRFVYEDGCKKCHVNMFPAALSPLGAEAHLKYTRNPENTSCLQCHNEMGHYRGEKGLTSKEELIAANKVIYSKPTKVESFTTFEEKIPGTPVSFKMIAIPGGKFNMGTPPEDLYRRSDEGPVREVQVDSFWIGEIEVTWNEYLAFFSATCSQGRKETSDVDEKADGITGATPPWGASDQGWGKGTRPAITMSFHGAETYCRWLTSITGKTYRLPTEAEWEYAARAGTNTPYFFEGSPKDYESDGILNKIFGPDTATINTYVVYKENSQNKTQEPAKVKPNAFGVKNMLGNVAEFCLDYYEPTIYSEYPAGVVMNPRGPSTGEEHVVRGGAYNSSAKDLRVGRRDYTKTKEWLATDPQVPKSTWWYSDSKNVGFRVVCEYNENNLKTE